MSFFKKPAVLIVLSVILILASTTLSVHAKLGRKSSEVTDIFYSDTTESKSIATLLREYSSASSTIALIASDYGLDTDDVSSQAYWLDSALRYSRGDEPYIYSEYSLLSKALVSLERQLESAGLNANDAAQVEGAFDELDSLQAQILALASDYNGQVRSFHRRYGGFPASFMASFAGVEMPEEFA